MFNFSLFTLPLKNLSRNIIHTHVWTLDDSRYMYIYTNIMLSIKKAALELRFRHWEMVTADRLQRLFRLICVKIKKDKEIFFLVICYCFCFGCIFKNKKKQQQYTHQNRFSLSYIYTSINICLIIYCDLLFIFLHAFLYVYVYRRAI